MATGDHARIAVSVLAAGAAIGLDVRRDVSETALLRRPRLRLPTTVEKLGRTWNILMGNSQLDDAISWLIGVGYESYYRGFEPNYNPTITQL